MSDRSRLDPRVSSLPVLVAFLVGVFVHAVDQLLHFRAGPGPVLLTAPVVSVLAYVRLRPETDSRWLLVLLCWGALGSGLAILGVYLVATAYRLPRPMTDPEMVLYDLGLFLWFVLALAGASAFAARDAGGRSRGLAALSSGPVLQFGWILVVVALAELWRLA